ncbi:helix-turn-helix transcriptional regulator [Actinomadura nitritigenes]|uniref:helix-turn-helix transcriptional regulator n=1 Tax=Actinomadura nitritigenes TaxID=134602 RepID=UPI003D93E37B
MTTFVGRERELAFLSGRLAEALDGEGGAVLIEGEAGAGKTALAHALARRARADGVRTAWGACLEGEGAAPYRPWTQVFRGLGIAPPDLAAGSRTRLFDEVAGLVRDAAGPGLLLVLDDLHWADPSSLALLQVVAAEAPDARLLLVGLYRGPEAPPALRPVLRGRACSPMVLGGLTPGETGRLAADELGHELDDRALAGLRERSGGNPLFVLELLRLRKATGDAAGLPSGVRDVIEQRAGRLGPSAAAAVRRAAVLGREFPLPVFTAVTGEPPEALDEAVAAGLVRVDPAGTARFSHALVQEALYSRLGTSERRRLHALAAEAVRADGTAEALAYHLREAGDAERALEATLEAARQAVSRLAHEHAAAQYRAALALPGAAAVRAGLLVELARCEFRSGEVEDGWRHCREAADLGRASGDARVVADAATVPRDLAFSPLTAQVHALCREALALLGDADPVRETRLLAQLAITADPWASTAGAGPALGERALAAAEGTGDPDALLLALQARHTELTNGRHVRERLALGERAALLGRTLPEAALWGHTWRMDGFAELGRRVDFDAELAAFTGHVERSGEPLWRWRLLLLRAAVALVEGRFAEGRARAAEARALGRRCRHAGAEHLDLVFAAHAAMLTGDGLAEVEPLVRRFGEQGPFFARSWLAVVLAHLGRRDEAAMIWRSVAPHLERVPALAAEWLIISAGHAELLSLLGEKAGAPAVYATLLPFAGRQSVGPAHTPWGGPVALHLGRLALLMEDVEAAGAHLAAALEESGALGSPPYQAMAHLELARLCALRRGPGDVRAAATHRETALDLAETLGMAPLADRARALARAGGPGPLSSRERQVAALIAEGLSNRQIAGRLHLSERTVENHISHILDKLGVGNRTLIASWHASRPDAERHGR